MRSIAFVCAVSAIRCFFNQVLSGAVERQERATWYSCARSGGNRQKFFSHAVQTNGQRLSVCFAAHLTLDVHIAARMHSLLRQFWSRHRLVPVTFGRRTLCTDPGHSCTQRRFVCPARLGVIITHSEFRRSRAFTNDTEGCTLACIWPCPRLHVFQA